MAGTRVIAGSLLALTAVAQVEPTATFKSGVELVVVPVVVRDSKGQAVGNLTKEDFHLFDGGNLQTISRFSIEKMGGDAISTPAAIVTALAGAPTVIYPATNPTAAPARFVAYFFDDIHLDFADLKYVRDAAVQHVAKSLRSVDRVAIITTSGTNQLDFTGDRDKIVDALKHMSLKGRLKSDFDCPPVTSYVADLIKNKGDPGALQYLTAEVQACMPMKIESARQIARGAANEEFLLSESESHQSMSALKGLVRQMSSAPGERSIVITSPGFLVSSMFRSDVTDLFDLAIRFHVTVSGLNARGLPALNMWDASHPGGGNPFMNIARSRFEREALAANEDVLAEIAEGTGGIFVHNTNDLEEGFRRIDAPEYLYLLGFSPPGLKYDGAFHPVKVTLRPKGLEMQARRGYYAPAHPSSPREKADREIREALFSRDEFQQFSIACSTIVSRPAAGNASLTMVVHIDMKPLPFQQVADRENDTLTIVYGLFDHDGKLLHSVKQRAEMRMTRDTFAAKVAEGLDVKGDFDVRAGKYTVRVVVRDSEGEMMSARNSTIDVP